MQDNRVFDTRTGGVDSALATNKVLRNTYMLLSMTLVFSAVCAGIAMAINLNPMIAFGLFIVGFVLSFVVTAKANSAVALPLIFAFTGCWGAAIGPMLNQYLALSNGPEIVLQALAGTAIIFFALSGYALTSRKDFSFMGGFVLVGLMVVVIAIIANIFLQIPAVSLAISSAVILLMSAAILMQTSAIIHGGETNYIVATVGLFTSLFNLFVHLLSLLGIMGGDD